MLFRSPGGLDSGKAVAPRAVRRARPPSPKQRNPARCHDTTVSGFTTIKALVQPTAGGTFRYATLWVMIGRSHFVCRRAETIAVRLNLLNTAVRRVLPGHLRTIPSQSCGPLQSSRDEHSGFERCALAGRCFQSADLSSARGASSDSDRKSVV